MEKKIIVTGGAGYIGSHTVVELFNNGYEPIVIDNFANAEKRTLAGIRQITGKEVKLYEGDCQDNLFLTDLFKQENSIEGIIHFAAYKAVGESVREPLKYYRNNIVSTLALLELMPRFGIKNFVFSSSCTVYGEPDKLPVTEITPKQSAESPYGNTKQICEEIIEDNVKSGAPIKAIPLRYFNPVGAHPTAAIGELPLGVPNNLVPFVTQTAAGVREKLTIFGDDYNTPDGTCIRDYIHVVDLAKAHVKALEFLGKQPEDPFYDVFNIGTGKGNSVMEVVQTFERVNNLKLNYVIGPRRSGDIEQVYADASKAEEHLQWKAAIGLEQSLRDSWRWQQAIS